MTAPTATATPSIDPSGFKPVMYEKTAPTPITGIRAKSKAFVNCSVILRCVPSVLVMTAESFRRPIKTATPEINSIRLSPPNANKAKLPAITPNPIEPSTSIIIQAELAYSILIPFPILICLHDWWMALQQHEPQIEQSAGVLQGSHDVSAQPHVGHDDTAEDVTIVIGRPASDPSHTS